MKGQVICINDTIRYVGKDVGNAVWSNEDVLTGANNGYDGRVNMAIIKKISGWKDLYPAFALCDALNTGNVTGWYLPAREELFYIKIGGSGNKDNYWSSTEDTAKRAYIFYNGPYIQHKSSGFKVKAVHRF